MGKVWQSSTVIGLISPISLISPIDFIDSILPITSHLKKHSPAHPHMKMCRGASYYKYPS